MTMADHDTAMTMVSMADDDAAMQALTYPSVNKDRAYQAFMKMTGGPNAPDSRLQQQYDGQVQPSPPRVSTFAHPELDRLAKSYPVEYASRGADGYLELPSDWLTVYNTPTKQHAKEQLPEGVDDATAEDYRAFMAEAKRNLQFWWRKEIRSYIVQSAQNHDIRLKRNGIEKPQLVESFSDVMNAWRQYDQRNPISPENKKDDKLVEKCGKIESEFFRVLVSAFEGTTGIKWEEEKEKECQSHFKIRLVLNPNDKSKHSFLHKICRRQKSYLCNAVGKATLRRGGNGRRIVTRRSPEDKIKYSNGDRRLQTRRGMIDKAEWNTRIVPVPGNIAISPVFVSDEAINVDEDLSCDDDDDDDLDGVPLDADEMMDEEERRAEGGSFYQDSCSSANGAVSLQSEEEPDSYVTPMGESRRSKRKFEAPMAESTRKKLATAVDSTEQRMKDMECRLAEFDKVREQLQDALKGLQTKNTELRKEKIYVREENNQLKQQVYSVTGQMKQVKQRNAQLKKYQSMYQDSQLECAAAKDHASNLETERNDVIETNASLTMAATNLKQTEDKKKKKKAAAKEAKRNEAAAKKTKKAAGAAKKTTKKKSKQEEKEEEEEEQWELVRFGEAFQQKENGKQVWMMKTYWDSQYESNVLEVGKLEDICKDDTDDLLVDHISMPPPGGFPYGFVAAAMAAIDKQYDADRAERDAAH